MKYHEFEARDVMEKKKLTCKVAPADVLTGNLIIEGLELKKIEQITVDGSRMVNACIEAKFVIRKDRKDYKVVVPIDVSNVSDDEIRLDLEIAEDEMIETPGWIFRSACTGEIIDCDLISEEIYISRHDEIIRLCYAHENWDKLRLWLRSQFRNRLSNH
ncbi:hypothetical protein MSNKSG1_00773 [Marinobacter santoriniensis NKSG1]|uniref:Uncharacterized protein n=1 Tax=Marinobacter santoriniensis NKSG1 TaxID=1288826 RepID=M7CU49_9GAMM|nr:hypothetical protein [Marinobacter santoriniensis]EMP57111.1 hypothetical protein MSNKSG1_00773 [Marinobacter santoriniensis NKSG1]